MVTNQNRCAVIKPLLCVAIVNQMRICRAYANAVRKQSVLAHKYILSFGGNNSHSAVKVAVFAKVNSCVVVYRCIKIVPMLAFAEVEQGIVAVDFQHTALHFCSVLYYNDVAFTVDVDTAVDKFNAVRVVTYNCVTACIGK